MSSFEAGAAGARGVRGLEEQRAQKRFDLGSKIIEQEQGKIDASRQYAKEVYGVGEKEYDRIFKEKYEAVGRVGTTEMERKKLAQQAALKELELQQEMKRKEMEIEQRKAEEKGRMARDRVPLEQQVFAGYLRKAGGDVVKANELMREAGVNERGATPTDRLRAAQSILNDYESTAEEKVMARREISQIMSGSKGAAAPAGGGKPITKAEYDKLPKGATYTAPDGTQRTKG
jgi:hypothetical protein